MDGLGWSATVHIKISQKQQPPNDPLPLFRVMNNTYPPWTDATDGARDGALMPVKVEMFGGCILEMYFVVLWREMDGRISLEATKSPWGSRTIVNFSYINVK